MTLSSVIASFFLGQYIASFGLRPCEALLLLSICAAASVVSALWVKNQFRFYPCMLTVGVITVLLRSECIGWYEATDQARFLVQVASVPQRPKPNVVQFALVVLQVLEKTPNGLVEIVDPLLGKSLYCTAPEFPWKNISGVRQGDQFIADLAIISFHGDRSPISYESTLRRKGIAAQCRIKNVARALLTSDTGWYEHVMTWLSNYDSFEMEGGLFASLIFGYRNSLSQSLEKHFQYAGLSHLLVFSGAQVTIIFVTLNWVFYLCVSSISYRMNWYKGAWVSKVIALGLTFFFVLSIGSDKTTVRALIAASVSFAAMFFQRKSSVAWGILIASFVLSIIWPGSFMEPGLQLTYAALFGIWLGILRRSFIWGFLYTSFSTSCVSLFWFEAFSIVGFIVNPLVVPLVSFVTTVGGLPALALALLDLRIGKILLEWNFIFLTWLEEGVYQVAMLSWSYFQIPAFWARIAGFSGLLLLAFEAFRLKKVTLPKRWTVIPSP